MEVHFTAHALYQMAERNISRHEVQITVQEPEKMFQQSSGRMRAVRRRDQKYLLVVIYEIRRSHKEVITTFITSKIYKYL